MADTDVLIIGAGPTGLVLALWLTKQGIGVRIIDKTAQPGTTSRALAVQARTLELYRQLDLTDAVICSGHQVPAFNFWAEGTRRARIPFQKTLGKLTAYPFVLVFPQDEHERLLIDRLSELGVTVERNTELVDFIQSDEQVCARLRVNDDSESHLSARYIAGCDGARSLTRTLSGIAFPGGTYSRFFYVADLEAEGPAVNGEIHINLDTAADFLAVFPLKDASHVRLVGTVLDERADRHETLTFNDISQHALARMNLELKTVNWFSTYRVHHRVAHHLRDRRAFLLGDAGHIHSPAGGQGMNTGIADAINLAWKLAAVICGKADDALLDTYEAERIAFARRLVATTDRVFTVATSDTWLAQLMRTRIAPVLVPLINNVPAIRRFNFRTVSQIALHYRNSQLSAGKAGRIRGGDRLPWVRGGNQHNFLPLNDLTWQVHVYGNATPALESWCTARQITLCQFAWTASHHHAGFKLHAAYLIRPDGYVAIADPAAQPENIEQFLVARNIK